MTDVQARTRPTSASATSRPPRRMSGQKILNLVVILLVGMLLGVFFHESLDKTSPAPPAESSVDVGFAQDMSIHHGQAVEMAAMALTNSTDPAVRTLAYDIVTTQQGQFGIMQGWLMQWDRPLLPSRPYLAWMTNSTEQNRHDTPDIDPGAGDTTGDWPTLPGMATPEELSALRAAAGPQFDALFLQQMLRHHQGGIQMAQYAAENAAETMVQTLAGQIVATQENESRTITEMLAAKGVEPLPDN